LNVCLRLGRKAAFIGRSIERKSEIAKNLGYLHYPSDLVVKTKQAKDSSKAIKMKRYIAQILTVIKEVENEDKKKIQASGSKAAETKDETK